MACAGIFPADTHRASVARPTGSFPYPNTMQYWPQFRSPLVWDVFAVSTYFTISLLFWFVGLIPDLATLRDRSENRWAQIDLRHAGHGMARFGAALAPLRNDVPVARRSGHAAGALGAHGGQLRFRDRHRSRLAHHHLPALFLSQEQSTRALRWC